MNRITEIVTFIYRYEGRRRGSRIFCRGGGGQRRPCTAGAFRPLAVFLFFLAIVKRFVEKKNWWSRGGGVTTPPPPLWIRACDGIAFCPQPEGEGLFDLRPSVGTSVRTYFRGQWFLRSENGSNSLKLYTKFRYGLMIYDFFNHSKWRPGGHHVNTLVTRTRPTGFSSNWVQRECLEAKKN